MWNSSFFSLMSLPVKWIWQRTRGFGLILLYHRIADVGADPMLLSVSPDHFAEHLDVMSRWGHPVRLQEVCHRPMNSGSIKNTFIITFDDGYADNLHNAKPILQSKNIPATVFVATGHLGGNREYWWDELERLLLQPGELPEGLMLDLEDGIFGWRLDKDIHYEEDAWRSHCQWNVLMQGDPTRRHGLYRLLCAKLRSLDEARRERVLDRLRTWAGMDTGGRPTYRSLTPSELIRISEDRLVEIGAHTVTHPVLSMLPTHQQEQEIREGKEHLEAILDLPVLSFAYPYGTLRDYTSQTVSLVKNCGFLCACSNFSDILWQYSNPLQLPRLLVRNWDGDEFGRRLSRWTRA